MTSTPDPNKSSLFNAVRRGLVRISRPLQMRIYAHLVDRAATASRSRDHASAATWARRAVRVRSTAPDAWLALGRAEASLSNWRAALDAANEALKGDSSLTDARALRFECLLKTEQITEAVTDWHHLDDSAIAAISTENRVLAALLFLEAGHSAEAAAAARTARHEGAASLEVEALVDLDRAADLIELLPDIEGALSDRLRAKAWFRIDVERNRLLRASWWLDQLADDPQELEWSAELSEMLVDQDLPVPARSRLDRALSLVSSDDFSTGHLEPLVKLTRLARALGANQTALVFGKALAEHFPDHPWSWIWYGRVLRAEGNYGEAREAIERAISLHGDLIPAWDELTGIFEESGETGESAIAANQRFLELAFDQPLKALRAISNLVELGERSAAREHLERLVSKFPDDPDILAGRYLILRDLGEAEDAAAALNEIDHRSDVPGRAALFRVRLQDEAYAECEDLLKSLPPEVANPTDVIELASGLRFRGEPTRALNVIEHACPDHGNPRLERLLRALTRELNTLSGNSHPEPSRKGTLSPVKGRVLHMVGKSVPYITSGYTIRTKYLTEAQRRAGIDAVVLTAPGFPWSLGVDVVAEEEAIDGVTYIRCPSADNGGDVDIDRMADIVRRVRPAVLHAASDFRNAANALALGGAFGLPVIYEVRGFWEETWVSERDPDARQSEHFRLRKERESECMRAVDRVVTLSETLKGELIHRGVDDERITVVPNAVDADSFPVQERDPALALRLGIAPQETTVGYISSLVAYEGVEYLLEAVAELRNRGRPVKGVIVGDGQARPELELRAVELGIEDVVTFTGRVPYDEILNYYGVIDVFVVPRTADRVCQLVTPLKPYEAMATGRALVVSGVDALREIVDDGVTGLIFEPENSADLARQLDRLITDSALRTGLGARAATAVRQTHTWAANVHKYLDLYRDMEVL